VNVTVEVPSVPVDPPEVMAATAPPTETARGVEAKKPWTEMWALEPTGPPRGLRPLAPAIETGLLRALS
jgi:hypothetical protein